MSNNSFEENGPLDIEPDEPADSGAPVASRDTDTRAFLENSRMPIEHFVGTGIEPFQFKHTLHSVIKASGLPVDGQWASISMPENVRISRVPFRTLHAAAHHLYRLADIDGCLAEVAQQIAARGTGRSVDPVIAKAMDHAEAHAHEVDAVYPINTVIEVEGGPGIIDHDGVTRQWLSGAPYLEIERDADGNQRCKECGDYTVHTYGE